MDADPARLGKLGERTVLIGTRETVQALGAQLKAALPTLKAAGCIVISPEGKPVDVGPARSGAPALPVLGAFDQLPDAHRVLSFTLAIISLPAALATWQLRVRARLRELGIPMRSIPPLGELLTTGAPDPARVLPSEVNVVELIGRTPYGIDRQSVSNVLTAKRVLITGAGGSIGSELARIVATFHPQQLILMERAENALFEIDRQIARRFPDVPRKALLHDVVDADATLRHCVGLRPQVVFHAAAHKHVPLMEDHPALAVGNNLFATKSVADAATACGAERFVLISSDKAVNPTSVMGATKRLAEIYTQWLNGRGRTRCSMVRFGNVLGSACSVLPIWTGQLAEGGPLSVTDARMTRYFMTIHEAATLVIQAAAISSDAAAPAVFVLDMGEPVRILDLARRFVRAHGFQPRVVSRDGQQTPGESEPADGSDAPTLDIVLTGVRPGEKLYEELAYAAESLLPTRCPGIRAWSSDVARGVDVSTMIADLSSVRHALDRQQVIDAIRRHVPDSNLADSAPACEIQPKAQSMTRAA
jgi:FlaA1/EpsC-like NDP-sugar epimerase